MHPQRHTSTYVYSIYPFTLSPYFQIYLCLNVSIQTQFYPNEMWTKSNCSAHLSCAILFYLSYLVMHSNSLGHYRGETLKIIFIWEFLNECRTENPFIQHISVTCPHLNRKKLTWLIHCTVRASELYHLIVHFTVRSLSHEVCRVFVLSSLWIDFWLFKLR